MPLGKNQVLPNFMITVDTFFKIWYQSWSIPISKIWHSFKILIWYLGFQLNIQCQWTRNHGMYNGHHNISFNPNLLIHYRFHYPSLVGFVQYGFEYCGKTNNILSKSNKMKGSCWQFLQGDKRRRVTKKLF